MKNIAKVIYNTNLSTDIGVENPCNCDEIKMVVWCGIDIENDPNFGVMLCNATANEEGNDHPPCKFGEYTMVEWPHENLEDAIRAFDTLCANVLAAKLFAEGLND